MSADNIGLNKGAMLHHSTYRIEKVLGQGGFGITYLATDMNLDRLVAIKEFFPKDYCDRDATTSHVSVGTQNALDFVVRLKAKFLKEARNIARLDHPGIIKIHAAFEENNTAYYVMDYIEGMSLSDMVRQSGPLSEWRALYYIEKVAKALEYIHARKINHLDVKPANIMVRASDDNPILIDFGLSKQYDSEGNQTSTTPTGISHGYAPMEQYTDGGVKEFSPQTDLYSLAATLYNILSGATPPQATKLIDEDLTFPASIPQRLVNPISKAMSPGRKQRHDSVETFIREIGDVGTHEATKIRVPKPEPKPEPKSAPKPKPQPSSEPHKKSDTKMTIGIIAALLFIAVGLLLLIGQNSNKSAPNDNVAASAEIEEVAEAVPEKESVADMFWNSPLGTASYNGTVITDQKTNKKIPDGHGRAEIVDGQYKGSIYEGEFSNGKMHGEATYTLSNGDSFQGEYRNNKYHEGTYTIKSTGEYFRGSFDSNGQPDTGVWYDKNGQVMAL
ncbi:MAG: protein kinase [Bacteroidales bacterium]|nr:protein kinase [Bacteroidales bacterium]